MKTNQVKAFHPKTMGVMYPATILSQADKTCVVQFPTVSGTRKFTMPKRHVAVNGEFLANP